MNTHVFILRFWLEQREIEGAEPEWRGVIENVGSGERVYFINLDQVQAYLISYLETTVRVNKP